MPKRDPRLHDLSRDHHHALVLARRARRAAEEGSDADVAACWVAVGQALEAELEPHFEVEEEHLLPALRAIGETELVKRTLDQHSRLRRLPAAEGAPRDRLLEFGELLRDHVRFEEAEVFATAQKELDAADLAEVARASAATDAATARRKVREARAARKAAKE